MTSIGLFGLLGVAVLTQTVDAILTTDGALTGLVGSLAVSLFAWRYPDELVYMPRIELAALVFVLSVGLNRLTTLPRRIPNSLIKCS